MDGGDVNTYDLSAYTTNLLLCFTPGNRSTFNTSQLAVLNQNFVGQADKVATGTTYNALQYGTDSRSLIENTIDGSGNDALVGNSASNTLRGNASNDALNVLGGNDHYYGGAGTDPYLFINSSNTADVLDGRDTIWDFDNAGGDLIYLRCSTTLTNYTLVQSRMVQIGFDVELKDTNDDVLVIKNMTKAMRG